MCKTAAVLFVAGVHPFKCDRCKFTAAKRFQLTSHLRTHSEDRAFQCDKCPYAGRWRVQLRNHLAAHQSPTCIACPFCKIVFPHLRSLSHHRHVHRNIKGNVFDSAIREHVQLQFPVSDEERPPNNDGDICVSQEKLRIVSKNWQVLCPLIALQITQTTAFLRRAFE